MAVRAGMRPSRSMTMRWLRLMVVLAVVVGLVSVLLMLFGPAIRPDLNPVNGEDKFDGIGKRGEQWMDVLSWEPRAFLYHNFLFLFIDFWMNWNAVYVAIRDIAEEFQVVEHGLQREAGILSESKEECEHLIELAKPRLERSTVYDRVTGERKQSWARTSSGMFLERGQDKIVKAIEKKISDVTFIPIEHGEGLQVLHYDVGQKYEPHYDYYEGVHRAATVLMYLSDVEEGGETVFPRANISVTSLQWYSKLPKCRNKGLHVQPKLGDALLFWSTRPNSTLDKTSFHGGCPVIKGNKWLATKWLRLNEYSN